MAAEQLTQDQIWDDSALVDSWNDALDEYHKYHSIAAKGENLEQVLKEFEEADSQVTKPAATEAATKDAPNVKVNGAPEPARTPQTTFQIPQQILGEAPRQSAPVIAQANGSSAQNERPNVPPPIPEEALLSQSEVQKRLIMSWYYAGYYTGFEDGRTQEAYERDFGPPGGTGWSTEE